MSIDISDEGEMRQTAVLCSGCIVAVYSSYSQAAFQGRHGRHHPAVGRTSPAQPSPAQPSPAQPRLARSPLDWAGQVTAGVKTGLSAACLVPCCRAG